MENIKTCDYCGKQYKRQVILEKHKIPCKVLFVERVKRLSTKEPIFQSNEEPTFSLKQVNLILAEVILQNKKMQDEINELKKMVFKTKIKINILDWLQVNISPTYLFQPFVHSMVSTQEHVEFLQENKMLDLMELVLSETIKREKDNVLPIFCFNEKIYIYDRVKEENDVEKEVWREMNRFELINFMNRVHKKIMGQIKEWRDTNDLLIKTSDIYYNINHKLSIKIMDIDFHKDLVLNKIRTILFVLFKRDVKSIVEYEFV